MNTDFQIYQLDPKAYDYIADRLDDGLTLTKRLKKVIDFSKGNVLTYAPINLTPKSLVNFNGSIIDSPISEDGVQKVDNEQTSKWLVGQMRSFLSYSKDYYCIFEEADGYPASKVISRYPFKNVLYKQERYYIIDNRDSDEDILEAIVQSSSFYPLGMGIFTSIENISTYFSDNDHIEKEEFFEVAAKNTQKIYIQAYDHDGYVLWERNK